MKGIYLTYWVSVLGFPGSLVNWKQGLKTDA